jgi:hypothetical protein
MIPSIQNKKLMLNIRAKESNFNFLNNYSCTAGSYSTGIWGIFNNVNTVISRKFLK